MNPEQYAEPSSNPKAMLARNLTPAERVSRMLGSTHALHPTEPTSIPQAQLNDLLEACNIPLLHWRRQVIAGQWESVRKRLSDAPRGSLHCLCGGRGVGKTQIAIEVARPWLLSGRRCLYATPVEIIERLSSARRWKSEESEVEASEEYATARLLIVDEYGRNPMPAADQERLLTILDRRYRAQKSSLLICNAPANRVNEILGDSLTSRLNECGGVIACDWPSFREGETT